MSVPAWVYLCIVSILVCCTIAIPAAWWICLLASIGWGILLFWDRLKSYKRHTETKIGLIYPDSIGLYQFDLDTIYHNRCHKEYDLRDNRHSVHTSLRSTYMLTMVIL